VCRWEQDVPTTSVATVTPLKTPRATFGTQRSSVHIRAVRPPSRCTSPGVPAPAGSRPEVPAAASVRLTTPLPGHRCPHHPRGGARMTRVHAVHPATTQVLTCRAGLRRPGGARSESPRCRSAGRLRCPVRSPQLTAFTPSAAGFPAPPVEGVLSADGEQRLHRGTVPGHTGAGLRATATDGIVRHLPACDVTGGTDRSRAVTRLVCTPPCVRSGRAGPRP